ncbi:MAG: YqgE/AlgH family protein [Gammaproteobacteria bacterium]|nr:YqgE/AlgH family protein [Gammaproteobacteria bacterium]
MESYDSLHNQLLIAMPGMLDPNFSTTVTLICEHSPEGALGIIINRPTEMSLGGLFEQLDLRNVNAAVATLPVMNGGPVAPERGFVLHDASSEFESTVAVSPDIQLTMSRDILDSLAEGAGPDQSLIALGYAGWQAGQLEDEILQNTWLHVPASKEILFEVPFENRWEYAASSLGIDISRLSPHAGHA